MACRASIGGFRTSGERPGGSNCPLKVGIVTPKRQCAVRVNMAYSQTTASSSVLCSASLYKVLNVPPDASTRDLKIAYRRMALLYHPDVCPPAEKEECSRMFVKIRAAYETLSDPILRQDYDWGLQNNLDFSERMVNSGANKSTWEGQLTELIRRSNCGKENTWGGRMRSRNQQRDAPASSR